MRSQLSRNLIAIALCGMFAAGCSTADPDVPMATDGPNQVVLKVPGMW